MSQPPESPPPSYPDQGYSPQYGFMPYYLTPPDDLLGPARRASLMLFILGGVFLLAGTCIGSLILSANQAVLADMIAQMKRMNPEQAGAFTPTLLRTAYGIMAGVVVMAGVVGVILGVVVRGGRMAAAVVSLVLTLGAGLIIALMLLGTLVAALGNPDALLGALVLLVPLVLIAMTVIFLIGAIRAARGSMSRVGR